MAGKFRKWVRTLGYDISPFPGSATHWGRIVETLKSHDVDCLLDVGANTGQYARAIRTNGYPGKIISFEPLSHIRHDLEHHAASDAHWDIAPRTAVGADMGEVEINISGESDMSSILSLDAIAHERLASTRAESREKVPVTTVAKILKDHAASATNIFLKSDTQGYEDQVLDGIGASWDRITGLQLELSMQPIYAGQPDHLPLLQRLADQGFQPHLVIPGYWSRHYGRMLEYDAVFFRD
ncbi:MAG: FkbM family methyltransferase [Alphaproteobacteria bacterium]|jgi:FkbM family methyltransferase|nr:FkbM family methyltransferase [Alphaproteobacteria bacterium]